MNKIFCLGEAMSDTFISLENTEICDSCHSALDAESINKIDSRFRGNDRQEMICLPYGEKINISKMAHKSGGSGFNVAVGLKRLGLEASLIANLGDDSEGARLKSAMKNEGLDAANVIQSPKFETKAAIILNGEDGDRTILVYHGQGVLKKEMINWSKILNDSWFYLGPLPDTAKELIDDVLGMVAEKNLKLVVNPGSVQVEWPLEEIKKIVSMCELLVLNKEEAEKILRETKKDKEKLRSFVAMGAKKVVITDGMNGSDALDGKNFYHQDIVKVKTVDMTGAGDAYLAGVVGALINGKKLDQAMKWGAINSASVVTKIGAQEGLLSISAIGRNFN